MKQLIILATAILFITGCNNNDKKNEGAGADNAKAASATMETFDYPYNLSKPYQGWQPGDQKHAVAVLKMIKAWESKKLAECLGYFGDTVDMRVDMFQKVMPHDSLLSVLESSWADMASVTVKMDDWESVISPDKKDEWVTLWYKQIMTNKKGMVDSLSIVNDAKIVNGKITVFDEHIRHYPAAKK